MTYYGKRVGIMTMDGEIHQSMISDLEKKLGDPWNGRLISDRRKNTSMPSAWPSSS